MSTAVVVSREGELAGGLVEAPRKRRRAGRVGLWIGVTIVTIVVLATVVVNLAHIGHPDRVDLLNEQLAPSLSHPFGTDALGRDVFLRTVAASGLDIQVGLLTSAASLLVGMALGVMAGFFGGRVDAVLMRVMDALIAFPFMVLVIAFIAIFGVGLTGIYLGLIIGGIPLFARLTRADFLVLREQQFMMAAKTLGFSNRRIVCKHALPHLIRPNLVYLPTNVLLNILTIAALSFLGLGVQPPTPEWGAIIAEGQTYLFTSWWIATLPGLFVVVVGIGLSLTGEGMAERLRVRIG